MKTGGGGDAELVRESAGGSPQRGTAWYASSYFRFFKPAPFRMESRLRSMLDSVQAFDSEVSVVYLVRPRAGESGSKKLPRDDSGSGFHTKLSMNIHLLPHRSLSQSDTSSLGETSPLAHGDRFIQRSAWRRPHQASLPTCHQATYPQLLVPLLASTVSSCPRCGRLYIALNLF